MKALRAAATLALLVSGCGRSAASPAHPPASPHGSASSPGIDTGALTVSTAIRATQGIAVSSSASGAVIGRVVLDGIPPPMARRPVHVDTAHCGTEPKEDRSLVIDPTTKGVRYAVVTLSPRDGTANASPLRASPAIDQAKCEFYPYVTILRPGGSVIVVNSDAGLHDLHRLEPNGPGSRDPSPPGSRVPLTFNRPGRTRIVCDLHYWSSAWVVATSAPFAAVTDAEGAFVFRDVPAGAWILNAWQERLGERWIDVTVERDQTVRTLLALPLPKALPSLPSPSPSPVP